jgi:hypothetical protein
MSIDTWIAAMLRLSYAPISGSSPFGGPWLVNGEKTVDVRLSWWLFADSAPARQSDTTFADLDFEKAAGIAVDRHPDKGLIRLTYKHMP